MGPRKGEIESEDAGNEVSCVSCELTSCINYWKG